MTTNKSIIITLAALVLTALAPLTSYAAPGITNTKHDFKAELWNTGGQICIACHTPHNAKTTQLIPLWNHTPTATASFAIYASGTFNGTGSSTTPSDVSKACLSCHDGTVAVESFVGAAGIGTKTISGAALIGTTLVDDHPVGFTYDAALVTADTINTVVGLKAPGLIGLPLFAGKMECATCHDVHNAANIPKFLRSTNGGSALCLKCHIK